MKVAQNCKLCTFYKEERCGIGSPMWLDGNGMMDLAKEKTCCTILYHDLWKMDDELAEIEDEEERYVRYLEKYGVTDERFSGMSQ